MFGDARCKSGGGKACLMASVLAALPAGGARKTPRHGTASWTFFSLAWRRPPRATLATPRPLSTPLPPFRYLFTPLPFFPSLHLYFCRDLTRALLPFPFLCAVQSQRSLFGSLPVPRAGPALASLASCPWAVLPDSRRLSPFVALAETAAREALWDAGLVGGFGDAPASSSSSSPSSSFSDALLPLRSGGSSRIGTFIGAGMGSVTDVSDAGALAAEGRLRRMSPYFVPRVLPNMACGGAAIRFGLKGPLGSPNLACATGAAAIAEAFEAISRGACDAALAGGVDACLDAVSLGGFARARALSSAGIARPFDRSRDGFVLAEGAGMAVLETLEGALQRGATIYAEVRGAGAAADASHVTLPPEDGDGIKRAMHAALLDAGMVEGTDSDAGMVEGTDNDVSIPQATGTDAAQRSRRFPRIHYVNAHATSTPAGDRAELRAIAALLGPDVPVISSTKGATGHMLGAAGAAEAIFAALALRDRAAPPTVGLEEPEEATPLGVLNGMPRKDGQPIQLPATGPLVAMSNSSGFGGANVSLILVSPPQ